MRATEPASDINNVLLGSATPGSSERLFVISVHKTVLENLEVDTPSKDIIPEHWLRPGNTESSEGLTVAASLAQAPPLLLCRLCLCARVGAIANKRCLFPSALFGIRRA